MDQNVWCQNSLRNSRFSCVKARQVLEGFSTFPLTSRRQDWLMFRERNQEKF